MCKTAGSAVKEMLIFSTAILQGTATEIENTVTGGGNFSCLVVHLP